jgi:hypothetical protein
MVACAVVAVALIGTNGAAATGKITDINRPSVRSRCTMGCRSWRPITQSSPTSGLRTGDRGLLCAERRELAAATTRIWAGEVAGKRARLNPHLPLRAPAGVPLFCWFRASLSVHASHAFVALLSHFLLRASLELPLMRPLDRGSANPRYWRDQWKG